MTLSGSLHLFTVKFSTTQPEANQSVVDVIARLPGLGICADRRGDIEIALTEVVNNVVEHACRDLQRAEGWITCWVWDKALYVKISDTGRPMPVGGPPTASRIDLSGPVADLPEGGFGWYLIRQTATAVIYDRQNGKNCLTLQF